MKKIRLGATGEMVQANVKRLRGGMQYKELSAKLADIGRSIPPLGLRRIEAGERRVDVDDLMALAVVFGVSPLTILLPPNGAHDLASPMTGVTDREVAHNVQWKWGLGEWLPTIDEFDVEDQSEREFNVRSIPKIENRMIDGTPIDLPDDFSQDEHNRRSLHLAEIQGLLGSQRYLKEQHGDS